jgi:hypothetical protein
MPVAGKAIAVMCPGATLVRRARVLWANASAMVIGWPVAVRVDRQVE